MADEALGVAVMLMNPQSRGSVTISFTNAEAMPVIDVDFLAHPYDRKPFVDSLPEVRGLSNLRLSLHTHCV